MKITMNDLPIATRRLVESYAAMRGISPAAAAYFLASEGRTTRRNGRPVAVSNASGGAIFLASEGRTTR